MNGQTVGTIREGGSLDAEVEPGEHRLRLFGIRNGGREVLGDYAFQIAP